jgi:predicted DNA-binding transcriptional regulator YafY
MSRILERLLNLDQLIRSPVRHTAESIAAELEVSERTVRSDISLLKERYHAPIAWCRFKGYYYSDPNWRLPAISLSKGELFALTVGARMLNAYAGSVFRAELESAIARLAERLPEPIWLDLHQLTQEHLSFRAGAETDLDPDIWHKLEDACRHRKTVSMTYYTASRNAYSDRKVDPYLLHIYRGTNPYVIGYCHTRQEVRWFRVDRIQRLEIEEEEFFPDPTFDPKDHLESIFQHEAEQVIIRFDATTAPFIRGRRWHPSQEILEEKGGGLLLKMYVRGLNDVKRWVLGYGKGAIVLEPIELVELVREEIGNMAQNYRQSEVLK